MAAGAWSRSILATVAEEWALPIIPAVKPRKVKHFPAFINATILVFLFSIHS